jgi:hypothetical protein
MINMIITIYIHNIDSVHIKIEISLKKFGFLTEKKPQKNLKIPIMILFPT